MYMWAFVSLCDPLYAFLSLNFCVLALIVGQARDIRVVFCSDNIQFIVEGHEQLVKSIRSSLSGGGGWEKKSLEARR